MLSSHLLNYAAIQVDACHQLDIDYSLDSNHFEDFDDSSDGDSLDKNRQNKVTVELKLKIFLMLNFEMVKEEATQIQDLDRKSTALEDHL